MAAGELFREVWYVGKETTAGVPVPPTRKVYLTNPSLTRTRASRPHPFMTGTRDNVRAHTLGPVQVAGQVAMPVSGAECLEWLLTGLQGGVTPTTPGTLAKLWTFTPGLTLDTMSIQRFDGARWWHAWGVSVDQMTFAGNVEAENTFTATLFGQGLEPLDTPIAAPADRVPSFAEGWETRFYVDNLGATPGTTEITQFLSAWTTTINNNLARKYLAANTLNAAFIPLGALAITGQITVDAQHAQALTEYLNWDGQTNRLIRMVFGNNKVIDAGTNQVLTITTTGVPTGGTFTLTYSGQTTSALPYNATAAQVASALKVLNNIGYNDVTATGGPLPTGIVVTFQNGLGGQAITLTHTDTLTGGSTPAVAIANTTPGTGGFNEFLSIDLPGAWSADNLDATIGPTRGYQQSIQYVYDSTNAFGVQVRAQSSRATAW